MEKQAGLFSRIGVGLTNKSLRLGKKISEGGWNLLKKIKENPLKSLAVGFGVVTAGEAGRGVIKGMAGHPVVSSHGFNPFKGGFGHVEEGIRW